MIDKIIWCKSDLFPYYYGFCPSERAWDRQIRKWGLTTKYDTKPRAALTSFFHNVKNGDDVAVVTIGTCRPQSAVNLIVHEAVHVWRAIRESVGEHEPSQELEAYYIQDIFLKLATAFEKTRGPLIRA